MVNPSKVHRNLSTEEMVSLAVERKEGVVNSTGSLSVNTGKYTGRSPDRFIVYDDKTMKQLIGANQSPISKWKVWLQRR